MKLKIKFTNVPKPALPSDQQQQPDGAAAELPNLTSSFSYKRKIDAVEPGEGPPAKRLNSAPSLAAAAAGNNAAAPAAPRGPFKITIKRPEGAPTPKPQTEAQRIAKDVFNTMQSPGSAGDKKQQAKVSRSVMPGPMPCLMLVDATLPQPCVLAQEERERARQGVAEAKKREREQMAQEKLRLKAEAEQERKRAADQANIIKTIKLKFVSGGRPSSASGPSSSGLMPPPPPPPPALPEMPSLQFAPSSMFLDATGPSRPKKLKKSGQAAAGSKLKPKIKVGSPGAMASLAAPGGGGSYDAGAPPPLMPMPMAEDAPADQASLMRILDKIQGKDKNKIFYYPVTEAVAPNYFSIIQQPMDFSTIR